MADRDLKGSVIYLRIRPSLCRSVAGISPLKLLFAMLLEKQFSNDPTLETKIVLHAFSSNEIDVEILTGMLVPSNSRLNQVLVRSNCYCLNPYRCEMGMQDNDSEFH